MAELDKLRHTIRLMVSDPSKALLLLTPSTLAPDEVYRPLLREAILNAVGDEPTDHQTLMRAAEILKIRGRNAYIVAVNLTRALQLVL